MIKFILAKLNNPNHKTFSATTYGPSPSQPPPHLLTLDCSVQNYSARFLTPIRRPILVLVPSSGTDLIRVIRVECPKMDVLRLIYAVHSGTERVGALGVWERIRNTSEEETAQPSWTFSRSNPPTSTALEGEDSWREGSGGTYPASQLAHPLPHSLLIVRIVYLSIQGTRNVEIFQSQEIPSMEAVLWKQEKEEDGYLLEVFLLVIQETFVVFNA